MFLFPHKRIAGSIGKAEIDDGRREGGAEGGIFLQPFLAPVYGWFTQRFDTADLKEAKALLDQLA